MGSVEKSRLIIFDVEGVLIPKNRFIFEVGKSLGLPVLLKLLFLGLLYEMGILKLKTVLQKIFSEIKGIKLEKLMFVFGKIPTTPYLQNLLRELKGRNCKVALISSGIPTVMVKKIADQVGADYAYGVEIEVKDGKLTGRIWGDAISRSGKLKVLRDILEKEKMVFSDCVVVADDRNNLCIFVDKILKIGFNPDFILRIRADRVINGKLSSILPVIDGKPRKWTLPSVNDFIREDIHAAGFFIPVISSIIGQPIVAALIILTAIIYTISELWRLDGGNLPLVSAIVRHAASQSELHGFAAAPLYFAFGIVTTLILFPPHSGGAAIAMFCLGDSTASLFGGMVSTSLPFNKGKTIEGSLAGFLFAFLAGYFFVSPLWALVGAAIAMTVEVLPLPINDNISVPIITGTALTLLVGY